MALLPRVSGVDCNGTERTLTGRRHVRPLTATPATMLAGRHPAGHIILDRDTAVLGAVRHLFTTFGE
jgi:hypothetical protein